MLLKVKFEVIKDTKKIEKHPETKKPLRIT